jgi:membrane protein YdbS with pleckstrin-like domain
MKKKNLYVIRGIQVSSILIGWVLLLVAVILWILGYHVMPHDGWYDVAVGITGVLAGALGWYLITPDRKRIQRWREDRFPTH